MFDYRNYVDLKFIFFIRVFIKPNNDLFTFIDYGPSPYVNIGTRLNPIIKGKTDKKGQAWRKKV